MRLDSIELNTVSLIHSERLEMRPIKADNFFPLLADVSVYDGSSLEMFVFQYHGCFKKLKSRKYNLLVYLYA